MKLLPASPRSRSEAGPASHQPASRWPATEAATPVQLQEFPRDMESQVRGADPKTAVLIRHVGIGDLVWHLPYIRAVAAASRNGKVSVIAAPSTRAKDILAAEDCIDDVILYDRNPRRSEGRKGHHRGFAGLRRFARELQQYQFERIFLFSRRYHHGILAWLAKIPTRIGFGTNLRQRLFLNQPPFISKYEGAGVGIYEEATALMIAHGIVPAAIVPRMKVPAAELAFGQDFIAKLPRPTVCFAIGTSEKHKHWGDERYGALAAELVARGYGVVLLGGPGEEDSARRIVAGVPEAQRAAIQPFTRGTIMQTAGILLAADGCVGNDTGVINMAAATGKPAICLLGKRPLLLHDPAIHCLNGVALNQLAVTDVLAAVTSGISPGR